MVMNPVCPTMRWSGRTLRSVTCHPRFKASNVSMCWNPLRARPARTAAPGSSWAGTRRGPPGSSTARGPAAAPRLGHVEHGPVVALPRCATSPRRLLAAARPRSGIFPKNASTFATAPVAMLVPELVGDDPALRPDGPAQRDRERARAGAGLEDARPRMDVRVGHDRPQVLRVDDLSALGASSGRSRRSGADRPRVPCPSTSRPRRPRRRRSRGRARGCRCACGTCRPSEVDEVGAVALVDQHDALAGFERPRSSSCVRRSRPA